MRPAVIIGLTAIAIAVAGIVLVGIDLGSSAGREEGVTLRDVADEPQQYAGQTVTVSGEIAENQYFSLADADVALVIGDDADRRLLVLPRVGTTIPRDLDENTVLRVTGEVQLADPGREDDTGFLDEGGLLSESQADAVIRATSLEIPTDQDPGTPPIAQLATVSQLLEDPRAFDERPLLVPGRIARIGQGGFVLAGTDDRIFVGAPYADLSALQPNDRVRVRAELEQLSRFRANSIPEALAGTPQAEGVQLDPDTPSDEGDPFLVLRAVLPQERA